MREPAPKLTYVCGTTNTWPTRRKIFERLCSAERHATAVCGFPTTMWRNMSRVIRSV